MKEFSVLSKKSYYLNIVRRVYKVIFVGEWKVIIIREYRL